MLRGLQVTDRSSTICRTLLLITGIAIMSLSTASYAQSAFPFVDTDFNVPKTLETERFRLRMLTVNDVVKDYDAVMTSIDHLQGAFGPDSKWPSKELTREQDLIDLGWHQKEFQKRSSFAYTVMSPDESVCTGCVYMSPPRTAPPCFLLPHKLWRRPA